MAETMSPATERTVPRILMCAPTFFEVDYVINPWMDGHLHDTTSERSGRQWDALKDTVSRHADVVVQPPAKGLPDMTFCANAGLVYGNTFVPSRFRYEQRQGEEAHDRAWFAHHGFDVVDLPEGVFFEGAGDALFDRGVSRRLWMGHGHRSDAEAAPALASSLDVEVLPLKLVDPRFYHLDTCFCPLSDGYTLYFPAAFDADSLATIERHVPPGQRLVVEEHDAVLFACNAVNLGRVVILNRASADLRSRLEGAGFMVIEVALDEFMKAGGSAKCLTLRLDELEGA
ncbi:arginine deiminase-related protein [Luteibacter sp. 3190]|uniref:dimethylarginine dimethylaminohydrolase family protein n=1 Tax=Luteibacter sp. 3190 TaxID=2817736 RepID=UPI002864A9EA|nr:arginine deiminase-related protein [Luteibacter sp. 3190]MDR6936060.1 N-dimethylarginine dimethylaminohydrolase [Luteibacter sp. 3190]